MKWDSNFPLSSAFVMRLIVVALTAFVVPIGILGYIKATGPSAAERAAEESVDGWLAAQRDGKVGGRFWDGSPDSVESIPRIERWEFVDVSSNGVRAAVWRSDRHGDAMPPDFYLFQLTAKGQDAQSTQHPRIVDWARQNDPLSSRARKSLEFIEDWLVCERDGGDSIRFWSEGNPPSSINRLVRWTVVMPPQDSRKSSANVKIQQRDSEGQLVETTWNIGVEFQRTAESRGMNPVIVRASNMSD